MPYCNQTIIDGAVLVAGDIHGRVSSLIDKLEYMDWPCDHVICLGDFGIGFPETEKSMEMLNNAAKEHDTHIWLIRGNHDNPAEWKKEHAYSNIHMLQDNTVAVINHAHWYVIGGSVSLDRAFRTEGEDWWTGEEIKFELPPHTDIKRIYGILSHVGPTPPNSFMQVMNYYTRVSGPLIKEPLLREKETLQEILQVLQPKEWYFGHFHASQDFIHNECKCHCLDELVLRQLDNVTL